MGVKIVLLERRSQPRAFAAGAIVDGELLSL